jgi:hypothetical protein
MGVKTINMDSKGLSPNCVSTLWNLEASATRLVTRVQGEGYLDDRWLARRHLLERKLQGRRTTSKLPALIDLAFDRPIGRRSSPSVLPLSDRACRWGMLPSLV